MTLAILAAFLLTLAVLVWAAWRPSTRWHDMAPEPRPYFDQHPASEQTWRLACELSQRRSEQRR